MFGDVERCEYCCTLFGSGVLDSLLMKYMEVLGSPKYKLARLWSEPKNIPPSLYNDTYFCKSVIPWGYIQIPCYDDNILECIWCFSGIPHIVAKSVPYTLMAITAECHTKPCGCSRQNAHFHLCGLIHWLGFLQPSCRPHLCDNKTQHHLQFCLFLHVYSIHIYVSLYL